MPESRSDRRRNTLSRVSGAPGDGRPYQCGAYFENAIGRHYARVRFQTGDVRRAARRSASPRVQLFEIVGFPGRIGISRANLSVNNGAFFLDFTRPLVKRGWYIMATLDVPVIHLGEAVGSRIVRVRRREPHFEDLVALWAVYYPGPSHSTPSPRTTNQIAVEFNAHFPEGA